MSSRSIWPPKYNGRPEGSALLVRKRNKKLLSGGMEREPASWFFLNETLYRCVPMEQRQVMISVVIPMYNESEGVGILYDRLIKSAETWGEDFEVVLVNDGSTDKTFELCKALIEKDTRIKLISFTRNFGHQAAISAGLCYASGDYIAVIDADLQDPPEELSRFINNTVKGMRLFLQYAARERRGPSRRCAIGPIIVYSPHLPALISHSTREISVS